MKLLFIADIHGIKTNLIEVEKFFYKNKCDYLVILGDIFNNGYYVYDYDKRFIKKYLLSFGNKLIVVKGNCDTDKDFKELNIKPSSLKEIATEKQKIYITHGHLYNESNWDKENTILIQGHTHFPKIVESPTTTYIYVGSISKPRGNSSPSFLYYNEESFIIYDINGEKIAEKLLKKE